MKALRYSILLAAIFCVQSITAQEDAVFKQLVHEYTIHEDGSVDYHHFKELEIRSYYAFHRKYGETFIVYDPERERLSIREAYTLMKNGTKIEVPENAFNEVLPRFAKNAPPFNHLREMVITHTALEKGATIYLDYVRKTFPEDEGFYSGMQILPEAVPVEKVVFILRYPENFEVNHRTANIDFPPEISNTNGMSTYRWELTDLPARERRSFSPHGLEHLPGIFWTTSESLEKGWKKWAGQEVFQENAPAELKILADTMFTDKGSASELANKISDYIKSTSNIWNIDMGVMPFQPRSALECWKSGGGTPIEIALLGAQIMKAAGLEATPAIAMNSACYHENYAIRQCWDKVLIRYRDGDDYHYLDPLSKNTHPAEYSLSGYHLMPVLPGGGMSFAPAPEIPAEAKCYFELVLGEDGKMSGTMDLELKGAANPAFLLENEDIPFRIHGYKLEKVQDKWDVNLETSKIGLALTAKDSLPEYGQLREFVLPFFAETPDHIFDIRLPQESGMGAQLPYPLKISMEWEFELPDSLTLVDGVERFSYGGSVGLASCIVNQRGRRWVIERELELPARLDKSVYGDFAKIVSSWKNPRFWTFWLERKNDSD